MSAPAQTPAQKPHEAWFEDTWWYGLKARLQWTGWLQYTPNLVAATLVLLLAGIAALIGIAPAFTAWPLFIISLLLYGNALFDVATVRFGWHPAEKLPAARDGMDAFDLARARKSCRSFQKRKLSDAHRDRLIALAERAAQPEACIGSAPIRFEYLNAPLTVWPVVGAQEFLVAIAPREYHELAVVDIGRSLQKVVLEATRMGVATCWIGPGADPSSIAENLGPRFDAARDHVICVCAIGYKSRYIPLSVRFMTRSMSDRKAMSELFFADTSFSKPLDPAAAPYAEFGRSYEICQWSPSSYNGQTSRAVALVEGGKVSRVDFCAATKSRYYAMVALGIWIANWEWGCAALGINGTVEVLSTEGENRPELPRYVASWRRPA
jgi:nitroreductase